ERSDGALPHFERASENPEICGPAVEETVVNCTEFEERIALFVENDLSDAEVTAVERHLETCTDCREFAAGLRESQAMLKGLRRSTRLNSSHVSTSYAVFCLKKKRTRRCR